MFRRLRERLAGSSPWLMLGGGVVAGVLAITGFDTVLQVTSQSEFCSYCHAGNAAAEWRDSVHYKNASGAVVGCAQCHIPEEFIPKITVKVQALADVWRFLQGSIDTPEKYEARRLLMAERVWRRLAEQGSKECIACHVPEQMVNTEQPHVRSMHISSQKDGEPCTECHKGVAHVAPPEWEDLEEAATDTAEKSSPGQD